MKLPQWTIFVTVISALLVLSGNRVYYQTLSLEHLIKRSDLILLVKKSEPAETVRSIDITPKGKRPDHTRWPPYKTVRYHFEVQDVLKSSDGRNAPKVGRKITVEGAYINKKLSLHKKYYLENIRKSPIYEQYKPNSTITKSEDISSRATQIIFVMEINRSKQLYRFTVENARESSAMQEKIKEFLTPKDTDQN